MVLDTDRFIEQCGYQLPKPPCGTIVQGETIMAALPVSGATGAK
jgi:hypothetical protein